MGNKVEKLAKNIQNLSPVGQEIVKVALGALSAVEARTDIFLWANQTDGMKRELEAEYFFFNKNYTPYSVPVTELLNLNTVPIFLYDIIDFVNMGAGTGLSVRDISLTEKNAENVLAHVELGKVGRAETLLHLIENERQDIVEFVNSEHDIKRIKGVVVRFTHPESKDIRFYIVKLIQQAQVVSGLNTWQLHNGTFKDNVVEADFTMPTDNQVLIVGGDIFAFDQSKFSKLFNFDAREIALANEKGAIIDEHYKLTFPDLIHEIAFVACAKPALMKKLVAVNTDDLMDQGQVIETADRMQLELMTDDAGAIILADGNDVSTFLDIINDNYVQGMTGNSYLAKSKQVLDVTDDRP